MRQVVVGKVSLVYEHVQEYKEGCSESHSGAVTKQEALSVSRCEEKD